MLALLAAGVVLAVAAGAQDGPAPSNRFVCTALPPEAARAGCPLPAMPMQGGALSPEEELRAAVLQLRETVVQQKETLGSQREAIRELTAKLARCEGLAGGKAPGRAASGKDTMGDLPRDPGHVVEQLSRSLQTLKDRLESLEVAGRGVPGGTTPRSGAEERRVVLPSGLRGTPPPGRARTPGELGLGSGALSVWLRNLTCVARIPPPHLFAGRKRLNSRPPHPAVPGLPAMGPFTPRGPAWRMGTPPPLYKSPSLPEPDALLDLVSGDRQLPREVSSPGRPVLPFINQIRLDQSRRRPRGLGGRRTWAGHGSHQAHL